MVVGQSSMVNEAPPGRYAFCCTFRPLRAPELRGTLPCGARTFLSLRSDHPSACQLIILTCRENSAIGKAAASGTRVPYRCVDEQSANGRHAGSTDSGARRF